MTRGAHNICYVEFSPGITRLLPCYDDLLLLYICTLNLRVDADNKISGTL